MSGPSASPAVERCDVCVLGAGIAGLNALYVASGYLGPGARAVLVDTRPRSGGMWNDTYEYVRLHQPHPMFTAGDVSWNIARPPHHLATRAEVLGQFERCLGAVRERVDLVEHYGYRYTGHAEPAHAGDGAITVALEATANGAPALQVEADRLVKAFGFRVPENDPLPLSSTAVHSVSPHGDALASPALAASDTPIYVVGGGKTGMDTALELIARYPGRAVHLVVGNGTIFLNRDRMFPRGARRWLGGRTGLELFLDVVMRFDGDNERAVLDHFRRKYAVCLDERFTQYVFGVMSEAENAALARGTASVTRDYLEDVEDVGGRPVMRLRSGASRPVEPGSWFVNCTGYVMRDTHPCEPYASPSGRVLSIQPSSSVHILTTFGSYFLSHLYFLDRIGSVPLYAIDHQALLGADRVAFPYVCMTQILLNTTLVADATPPAVLRDCGLDFDRWYPFVRRLPAIVRLVRNKASVLAHCRRTLDRVAERYAVPCAPLPPLDAAGGIAARAASLSPS